MAAIYNGSDKRLKHLFDNSSGSLAELTDVEITSPQDGNALVYDETEGKWVNGEGGGGSATLEGLTDVELTTPTDGQALVYDGANEVWVNGNVSGGGSTLVIQDASIYSTEEQQVGVWTDGKPLYQKTIDFGALPNNATKSVAHGISNINHVVMIEGYATNETQFFPMPFTNNETAGSQVCVYVSKTNVSIRTSVDRSAYTKCFITLQYTKTTDAAGSGGYKAYGLSPIIYSTEEREVGVWIDGKPLYQKTFNFNNQTITDKAWTDSLLGTSQSGISIKHYKGYFGLTGQPRFSQFTYYRDPNEYFTCMISNNEDDISVRPNMNAGLAVTLADVTIWYTKTTDTAGSGIWTTTGEYSHHYSTSEKVVGTWVDGRPVYEITVEDSGAWNTSDHYFLCGATNIEPINIEGAVHIGGGNWIQVNSWITGSRQVRCYVVNGSTGQFLLQASWTFYNYRVTFLYTKTTDTPTVTS